MLPLASNIDNKKMVFTSRAHEGTVKNMIFCCGVGAGEVENLFNFFFVSSFKIRARGMFVRQALVGLAWKLVVVDKASESRALKLVALGWQKLDHIYDHFSPLKPPEHPDSCTNKTDIMLTIRS